MKRRQLLSVCVLWAGLGVAAMAQDPAAVAKQFEAGHYDQVIEAAGPEAEPGVVYMAALSHQKRGANDQAAALGQRLATLPEEDPWHFIGRSVEQLVADDIDGALGSADRAIAMRDDMAAAYFQKGLVLVRREAWKEAAAEFDRVSQINPAFAYAWYYAGLAHSRSNRPDLMAVRFERFLKLAPEAPERPEVMQIMRTLRGR